MVSIRSQSFRTRGSPAGDHYKIRLRHTSGAVYILRIKFNSLTPSSYSKEGGPVRRQNPRKFMMALWLAAKAGGRIG